MIVGVLSRAVDGSGNPEQKTVSIPLMKNGNGVWITPARVRNATGGEAGRMVRERTLFCRTARDIKAGAASQQAPDCSCSGTEGDAVRSCSLRPRPVEMQSAGNAIIALSSPVPLTPARWEAIRMARQFVAPIGFGATVTAVTALLPFCNWQHLDIATFSARLQRLHGSLTRDARVCVRVRAHVRTCAREAVTSVTAYTNLCKSMGYQLPSGYSAVTAVTALAGPRKSAVSGDRSNILACGYGRGVLEVGCSGVTLARPGENFGVFALGASSTRALAGLARHRDRNGGFLRVCRGAGGTVGRVMLEGMAETRGNAWFLRASPKPVGLVQLPAAGAVQAEGGRGRTRPIGPEAPPLPPSPAALPPSMSAHDRARIWIRVPVGHAHWGTGDRPKGERQTLRPSYGPGLGERLGQNRNGKAGRGSGERGALRRSGDGSAGVSHVN